MGVTAAAGLAWPGSAAADAKRQWTIFVVQHSHIDVGFTEKQEIIAEQHAQFIRQAVDMALAPAQKERSPECRFKFTCEGFWAVEQFLERATVTERRRLVRAMKEGVMELTAAYFHMTELPDQVLLRRNVSFAAEFARREGIPLVASMECDINGLSWGMADALADIGVRYLSMNTNPHHGGYLFGRPLVPFYWESPSGKRVLAWNGAAYHKANLFGLMGGLTRDADPEFPGLSIPSKNEFVDIQDISMAERKVLPLIEFLEKSEYPLDFFPLMGSGLHTDNSPPGDRYCAILRQWNEKHGGRIKIRTATLAEFFAHLEKNAKNLPVHKGEWTDWWSDGAASTPVDTMVYRNALRARRTIDMLDLKHTAVTPDKLTAIDKKLLLYAEHTFGYSRTSSTSQLRTNPITAAIAVLALAGIIAWQMRQSTVSVLAAQAGDGGVIWSIGTTDNSGNEFTGSSASSLIYDVSPNAKTKTWRGKQDAPDQKYVIRFPLPATPASPVTLAIEGFFMEAGPRALLLDVNGKRGSFRLVPLHGKDLDMQQGSVLTHTRVAPRIPIDPAFLRQGANEIAISLAGEGGGTLFYDSLRLEKSGGAIGQELEAIVEPTIFFRRVGGQLNEVTEVVIRHQRPLKDSSVSLNVGAASAAAKIGNDGLDFGESVVDLNVAAPSAPQPYQLTVTTSEGKKVFSGEYRPEKRWKLFAGLKIHNDIGYTDTQQNVEELDVRNTDRAIDFNAHYPFYKFNLEDAWLAENYINSRKAPRVKQFTDLAARNQIGIGGLYLNLLTGLASGEEMYRALYFSNSLRRKYGIPMKTASLTDTPSQPWSLPSFLADAGITGFTLASNQHRAPQLINSTLNEDSPFYWEGPDGRRVIAFYARSYSHLDRLVGDRLSGHVPPGANPPVERVRRAIGQALTRYRRPGYAPDALYLFGQSTDNADIRGDSIKMMQEWNATYEYPKLIPATDADYFDYISKNFGTKLPVARGDGGSYWADAAGSSSAYTVLNHDSQRLLPVAETIAAWTSLLDPAEAYPAAELRKAWKEVLFYDEHTWGAHNSVTQPDRDFVTSQFEFKQAHAMRAHWAANELLQRALARLANNITVERPVLLVFNPDYRPRNDLVEVEFEPNRQIYDLATGERVPMDIVLEKQGWRRVRFIAAQVPGLGYKAFEVRREDRTVPAAKKAREDSWEIDSRYYRITLDQKTGAVAHVFDKEANRDLVDENAPFRLNELVYAAGGEGQQIVRNIYSMKPTELDVTGQSGAKLIENVRTPFGQRIRIEAKAKNVPLVESEIAVYDNIKRIDIRNHIRKEDIRAKEAIYFAFPFRVSPPELQYQVHNSWVRPNADQLPGACREWFTTPNLVLSRDTGLTIAFATPDLPLVTLTDINRGRWLEHLDIKNGHVYSYVTNNYWSTNIKASQEGDITFRYFITSRKGLDFDALGQFDAQTRSALVGYNFFDWGNVRSERGKKRLPANAGSLFQIEAGNAQVTAFKEAEDGNGYILRLRETSGRDGTARLVSPIFRIARAFVTNGVEENLTPLQPAKSGIEIPLKSRRFSTVRMVFDTAAPLAKKQTE